VSEQDASNGNPAQTTALAIAAPEPMTEVEPGGRDQGVRESFRKMGGNSETLDNAIALRPFANGRIKDIIGLTMAGLAINSEALRKVIESLAARIEKGEFTKNEKGDPSEEAMVLDRLQGLTEQSRHKRPL
jgi:hypothetical protein